MCLDRIDHCTDHKQMVFRLVLNNSKTFYTFYPVRVLHGNFYTEIINCIFNIESSTFILKLGILQVYPFVEINLSHALNREQNPRRQKSSSYKFLQFKEEWTEVRSSAIPKGLITNIMVL